MSTIPDGMLSLIAPGLFSNLIIQPQQPGLRAMRRQVGKSEWILPPRLQPEKPPPTRCSALRRTAPLQRSRSDRAPIFRPRGLPRSRVRVNPPPMAVRRIETPDAEAQISEEDLAKLVAEGKAKIEARQDGKAAAALGAGGPAQGSSRSETGRSGSRYRIRPPSAGRPATVQIVREPARSNLKAAVSRLMRDDAPRRRTSAGPRCAGRPTPTRYRRGRAAGRGIRRRK